jgi:hypothetical protein
MKRLKLSDSDRWEAEYLTLSLEPPAPSKMAAFAAQFSNLEWSFLCEKADFVEAVDRDLEEATKIASLLLKRSLIDFD